MATAETVRGVEATASIVVDSPAGPLALSCVRGLLIGVHFRPGARPGSSGMAFEAADDDRLTLQTTASWLESYFGAGGPDGLPVAPPLRLIGTDFQVSVWTALQDIAWGETASYAEVARAVGRPSAVRAVAGAIGANPVSIVVPCHRVIGADGSLTGYGGGLDNKLLLLANEGWSPVR